MNKTMLETSKWVQAKASVAMTSDLLYENFMLITQIYPPSKELKACINKEMFVKVDKTTFQQTSYYLLMCLNPALTKEKIKTWPLLDFKTEAKYRIEFLAYAGQLNDIYGSVTIPNLVASHLISPGGQKFICFMLKLSQLVMFEHARRSMSVDVMLPPKMVPKYPSIAGMCAENLKANTECIEKETRLSMSQFELNLQSKVQQAAVVSSKQSEISDEIRQMGIKHSTITHKINSAELSKRLQHVKSQVEDFRRLHNMVKEVRRLLSVIGTDQMRLDQNGPVQVPKEVEHMVQSREQLDLLELISSTTAFLDRQMLEMPHFADTYLTDLTELFTELNVKYELMTKRLELTHSDLSKWEHRKSPSRRQHLSTLGDVTETLVSPIAICLSNDDEVLLSTNQA